MFGIVLSWSTMNSSTSMKPMNLWEELNLGARGPDSQELSGFSGWKVGEAGEDERVYDLCASQKSAGSQLGACPKRAVFVRVPRDEKRACGAHPPLHAVVVDLALDGHRELQQVVCKALLGLPLCVLACGDGKASRCSGPGVPTLPRGARMPVQVCCCNSPRPLAPWKLMYLTKPESMCSWIASFIGAELLWSYR